MPPIVGSNFTSSSGLLISMKKEDTKWIKIYAAGCVGGWLVVRRMHMRRERQQKTEENRSLLTWLYLFLILGARHSGGASWGKRKVGDTEFSGACRWGQDENSILGMCGGDASLQQRTASYTSKEAKKSKDALLVLHAVLISNLTETSTSNVKCTLVRKVGVIFHIPESRKKKILGLLKVKQVMSELNPNLDPTFYSAKLR